VQTDGQTDRRVTIHRGMTCRRTDRQTDEWRYTVAWPRSA